MGLIWDLIQQGQLSSHATRAESLEQRMRQLEDELDHTRGALHRLLLALEHRFGEDLDGDNRVG